MRFGAFWTTREQTNNAQSSCCLRPQSALWHVTQYLFADVCFRGARSTCMANSRPTTEVLHSKPDYSNIDVFYKDPIYRNYIKYQFLSFKWVTETTHNSHCAIPLKSGCTMNHFYPGYCLYRYMGQQNSQLFGQRVSATCYGRRRNWQLV